MSRRLVLGEAIGRGSCSTVYRAHDRLLDRDVAIKVFPVAADPRAEREVALMASLDHPGLVPVYDLEQAEGHAYVVTALFDGSLADRLAADGPIPVGSALLLTASVAEALAHVHRAGVLHRDVVPRNILFDGDGRAHLSDFGVATVADAPRLTDTGVVVGSAPYLAPELLRGGTAGPTSDVYSLGLVLIEALTGRRAYEGAPLEAAEARLTRRPPTPAGIGAEVTGALEAMTADEPDDRPGADVVCVRLRRAALAAETATPGRGLRPPTVASAPSGSSSSSSTEDAGMGSAARYGRSAAVLAAAAVSIMVAGGAVVASAWPVQSVSATMPPMASAAPPAAVAPLLPPPGDSPGGSDDGDSSSSSDSGSDSGSVEQARDSSGSSSGSTGSSSERSAGSSSGSAGSAGSAGSSGSEKAARPSPATRSATAKPSAPKSVTPKSAPSKPSPAKPVAPRIAPSQEPSDDTEDRSDEVQTVRDRVEDKADAAREKAQDKADAARERAQDKADAAKDRLQDTTDDATGDEDDDSDDSPTTTTRPRPGVLDPAVQALKPVTGLLGG